jgi:hypothetical protein
VRPLTIRRGQPDDVEAVLAMLDGAVRWLASTGRSGQWGTEPFTAEPERVAQVRAWAAGGGLRVAEADGAPEVEADLDAAGSSPCRVSASEQSLRTARGNLRKSWRPSSQTSIEDRR